MIQSSLRKLIFGSLVVFPVMAAAQTGLRVRVESDQVSYAFREPIKLTISVGNTSPSIIQIPQISRLNSHEMEFIYFEIEFSNGYVKRVKSRRLNTNAVLDSRYKGMPLAPGDSVQFYCYPVLTNLSVDEAGMPAGNLSSVRTFPGPGSYRLRVVLHTLPGYSELFGANGELRRWLSNTLAITIREPNDIETRILDTLWRADPAGEDGIGIRRGDLRPLERSIETYPDHPITKHSQFALGRLLYAQSLEGKTGASRAIDVLRDLSNRDNSFRYEEVRLFLAEAYREDGQLDNAFIVLSQLMGQRQVLWTDWRFVVAASTLTPDPTVSLAAWQRAEIRSGPLAISTDRMREVWPQQ